MYPREFFDTFWRPDIRDEVFVAMAFDDALKPNWTQIIKPAIIDAGLKPHRVDANIISGSILTEIMDGIAHSRLVLGDLTQSSFDTPNANVMYEVGLAHALREASEVLLIRGDRKELLFDVSHIRVHDYDLDDVLASRRKIKEIIINLLSEIDVRKNLKLQMTIEKLDDKCLRLLRKEAKKEGFGTLALAVLEKVILGEPGEDRLSREEVRDAVVLEQYDEGAVTRLLDLGIIRLDVHKKTRSMSFYRWTHLGRHVLVNLGYRETADVPTWKTNSATP